MKCDKFTELIPDFLAGYLDSDTKEQIASHIKECTNCKSELEQFETTWEKLGELPENEPGPALRENFYSMLETYQHGMNYSRQPSLSWSEKLGQLFDAVWPKQPAFQMAIALLFMISGLLAGLSIKTGEFSREELASMKQEISETRQLVTLSLLSQPSAIDRLEGVNMVSQTSGSNEELISALLTILNSDQNVNLRMAAVDKLYLFSGKQEVRDELVKSLSTQMSPLVQISLIDVLVELREKSALETFERISEDQYVLEPVKKHARKGIEQINKGDYHEGII
ncbi:HEAT repeat domain-containing protein [Candidatus Latescibacterota bacterium]